MGCRMRAGVMEACMGSRGLSVRTWLGGVDVGVEEVRVWLLVCGGVGGAGGMGGARQPQSPSSRAGCTALPARCAVGGCGCVLSAIGCHEERMGWLAAGLGEGGLPPAVQCNALKLWHN